MSKKIDREYAPDGTLAYIAGGRMGYTCKDCHYGKSPMSICNDAACIEDDRPDGQNVVFMTAEEHAAAKAMRTQ